MTSIGIFVFPGVEELDFVGPWEVLRSWQLLAPEDGVQVFTLAAEEGTIECAKGMRFLPDTTWATAPPIDLLLFPGGPGTAAAIDDETIKGWVRDLTGGGVLMTSVCTGALVYAAAGILDGLPATTYWASLAELAALGKDIQVRPDDRYVDAGMIITSAGVSAGIDMALYLILRLASVERAKQIKKYIQYDPAPPV